MHFNEIALKYDFSTKFQTNYIIGDYQEFKFYHNIQSDSYFSGEINDLTDILFMADGVEEPRRPSITLTLNCSDTTIVKKFSNSEIAPLDLFDIPYREDVYTGTVEIKSYKTLMYGLQVVWKKTASGPNWPINEFVKDGTISGTAPGIIKGGTNNGNGDFATRGGGILINTNDRTLLNSNDYMATAQFVVEENPIFSPNLTGEIYLGGEMSDDVEWEKPVVYKTL